MELQGSANMKKIIFYNLFEDLKSKTLQIQLFSSQFENVVNSKTLKIIKKEQNHIFT